MVLYVLCLPWYSVAPWYSVGSAILSSIRLLIAVKLEQYIAISLLCYTVAACNLMTCVY